MSHIVAWGGMGVAVWLGRVGPDGRVEYSAEASVVVEKDADAVFALPQDAEETCVIPDLVVLRWGGRGAEVWRWTGEAFDVIESAEAGSMRYNELRALKPELPSPPYNSIASVPAGVCVVREKPDLVGVAVVADREPMVLRMPGGS